MSTAPKKKKPDLMGRPPLPPEQRTLNRSIRLTAEQWAKFDRLGGANWVREQLRKAREPAPQD